MGDQNPMAYVHKGGVRILSIYLAVEDNHPSSTTSALAPARAFHRLDSAPGHKAVSTFLPLDVYILACPAGHHVQQAAA
jgi:hypothetical protein